MGVLSKIFERRDWKLSSVPDSVWRSWGVNVVSDAGVTVTPTTAMSYTAVYACVRILAESVASLPLLVFERLPDGGKRRAEGYPIFPVLHTKANPEMTAFELWEALLGHVLVWGNGYAYVEYGRAGWPVELWPLLPNKTQPMRRPDYSLVYRYSSEKLGVVDFEPYQVLHLRGLGFDGLMGYSPITLARQAVGLGLAAEEFGARFFGNDARPGGVLKHPGTLSDPAHERLKASWEARHGGLDKSHRTAILEEGLEYQEIGLPPEDAQFLETRKFQVQEIARIFRVPPHMLADLDRATFSNIEHQSIQFVTHTLRPWLVRIEKMLNSHLIPEEDRKRYFAEFLVDGLLRGDIGARYAAYAQGRQNGWLSANDIRRSENMNPIEGGDEYLVPLNMIPASQVSSLGVGSGERALRSAEGSPDVAITSGLVGTAERLEIRTADLEGRQLAAAVARRRLALAFVGQFAEVAGRVLRREANDVGNQAQKLIPRSVDDFKRWSVDFYRDFQGVVAEQFRPVMRGYGQLVSEAAAEEVGAGAISESNLERFVGDYAAAYAARHVARSQKQLNGVLSIEEPLESLEDLFGIWREERPEEVGQGESSREGNAVAKWVYVGALIRFFRWVHVGKSCPFCRGLHGRIVGIEQNFLDAGVDFQPEGAETVLRPSRNVGHPPAHKGCDCLIVASR